MGGTAFVVRKRSTRALLLGCLAGACANWAQFDAQVFILFEFLYRYITSTPMDLAGCWSLYPFSLPTETEISGRAGSSWEAQPR